MPEPVAAHMLARRLLVGAAALLAGVAPAVGCGGKGGGGGAPRVTTIELESNPEHLSHGAGRVWASTGDGALVRVDPKRSKATVVATNVPNGPLAAAAGSVWIADESEGTLTRVDPRSGRRSQVKLVNTFRTDDSINAIVAGPGGLWVAAGNGVMPVDPRTGRRTGAPVVIGGDTRALVVAGESLWALIGTGYDPRPPSKPGGTPDSVRRPERDYTLVRIDARRRRVVARTGKVTPSPRGLAVGNGLVWVMDTSNGNLLRLDPVTGRSAGAPFKSDGVQIAVDDQSVWVVDPRENTVRRLDPRSGKSLGDTGKVPDKEGKSTEVDQIVSDGRTAWVGSEVDPILARVDP